MKTGDCALCLGKGVQLHKSHIISKFGYRNLRTTTESNPNPVIIDKDTRFQSSGQITEQLLCGVCEDRLSKGCEIYVSSICYQENGDCPIYRELGHTSTLTDVHKPPAPITIECSKLNTNNLATFGMSIFWRASITTHKWANGYTLGSTYNETFRSYLNGERPFPKQACLQLAVIDQPKGLSKNRFDRLITVPAAKRIDNGYWQHGFFFNGLYFNMLLGNSVPKNKFESCLVHGTQKHLLFTGARHIPTIQSIVKKVQDVG